jgi:hypothetical protein
MCHSRSDGLKEKEGPWDGSLTETLTQPPTIIMSTQEHPFANAKGVLEVLPNDIDIDEELKRYEEICWVSEVLLSRPCNPSLCLYSGSYSVLALLYLVCIISSPL